MLTNLKNIAVFLDGTQSSEKLGDFAAELARRHGAHLIGIYCMTHAEREHPEDSYVRGERAINAMLDHYKSVNEEKVLTAGRHHGALSRAYDISAEFRVIWNDQGQEDVVLHSLHCDLIVIGHPKSHGIPENWTPDRLLRATGVPVLIVPDGKDAAGIGDKVLVAWNASREARRAITDAMPFIETAKTVTVLVIDADKGAHHYGEEPGADIALHLARHGAHVEVEQVSSHGKPIGEVILSYAAKCEADVIVIGARSHARPTEILFGGVTRTLLAQSTIPLVMSR